ncbi:tetratricopeptide repeat protein [Thalassotalea sp. M1531]|uniref:Ancillary SecYEG translocon subunit n=1 Tax=Thalassotalea algicola TaxID=2716224 RepID=A0A7Y0Q7G1_9GAMM|nr:tetratricopeptide repeat protein [Thalassotalea algicola]NMP32166.1 tetratricopeptide repeat protein [Thalassotalea algicola]
METFETEEQQVEAIKKFWSENGNHIIGGLVVGFAGFIGFNYYQDTKLASEQAIAGEYQAVLDSKETNHQGFKEQADKFIQANSESSYASLTALSLAKDAAEHSDWEKAAGHLTIAIEKAPSEGIKAIATVRLARVQIQQGEYDKALAMAATKLPEGFKAAAEEIKGDAYLKQGKNELARNAYQAAIDADGLATNPTLQLKIDDLAQATNLTK